MPDRGGTTLYEPFPKKRTRKFEEKQNESLSFWEMLVQAT